MPILNCVRYQQRDCETLLWMCYLDSAADLRVESMLMHSLVCPFFLTFSNIVNIIFSHFEKREYVADLKLVQEEMFFRFWATPIISYLWLRVDLTDVSSELITTFIDGWFSALWFWLAEECRFSANLTSDEKQVWSSISRLCSQDRESRYTPDGSFGDKICRHCEFTSQ